MTERALCHVFPVLILCWLVHLTGSFGFEFTISPRQVTVRPGQRTSILCRSSAPLTECRFLLPKGQIVDLSNGAQTVSTADYRYYGTGLRNGQCGITLLRLNEQVFSAVACQGRTEREGRKRAAMFLRVTTIPTIQWDIEPQEAVVQPGQNINLLCQSNVPLETCRFGFVKEDRWLELSQGQQSKRTSDYAYHGSGLEYGQCGITLYNVTPDLSGEVRCVGIAEGNRWAGDFFSLVVATPPSVPKLTTSSGQHSDGDILEATCTVNNGRPAPNVTWYLGNDALHNVITDVSPNDAWFDFDQQTVVQRLRRRLSCQDNGKELKCVAGASLAASRRIYVSCQPSSTEPVWPDVLPFEPSTTPPPIPTPGKQPEQSHSTETCGVAMLSSQLIVNGQATEEGHWPWIAALFVKKIRQGGLEFLCGGTLINKRHVVTAAHCINSGGRRPSSRDDIVVFLGKYNLNDWTEPNSQLKRVESIHVHPDYVSSRNGSDIAVITLSRPVEYTNFVRPICLWNKDPDLDRVVGQVGTVVGWGRFGAGESAVSDTPRLAKTLIVSQTECLRSNTDFIHVTTDKTFCAGYKDGSGPCNGDSGSGLVLPYRQSSRGRTQWFLRGIVSLALLDSVDIVCDLKQYVVYTDVPSFSTWLRQFS